LRNHQRERERTVHAILADRGRMEIVDRFKLGEAACERYRTDPPPH
jgi:hypothetical protein